MSKIEDFAFYGASGYQYIFQVYPLGTEFKDIGGVYIFTRREIHSQDSVTQNLLYIGQSISLPRRLMMHQRLNAVLRNGGNCICVYSEPNDKDRKRIESDLIGKYLPPLNRKFK